MIFYGVPQFIEMRQDILYLDNLIPMLKNQMSF